ncbi:MAG: DUF108 domain-containing protein [Candidatus Omnitrophica bacterium]|nr:DUF108 domain-containing protein [Candidatus Omnitrophota bacterium]
MTTPKIKVGIIGCGAIGTGLAILIQKKFRAFISLRYLCDHHLPKALELKKRLGLRARVVSLTELIRRSDFIFEAASAEISGSVAKKVLQLGKTALVMSVGGLLREKNLARYAAEGRLIIPSGAIAGVDGLLAGREGVLRKVRLITRKPRLVLENAPYFKGKKFPSIAKRPVCLFRGSAARAVSGFPQNINVAAVLSLAGLGAVKTEVEIWTAHDSQINEHEILLEGDFGRIRVICENIPSPENPKTSRLAILSAAAALRKYLSSVRIGT